MSLQQNILQVFTIVDKYWPWLAVILSALVLNKAKITLFRGMLHGTSPFGEKTFTQSNVYPMCHFSTYFWCFLSVLDVRKCILPIALDNSSLSISCFFFFPHKANYAVEEFSHKVWVMILHIKTIHFWED